MFRLLLLVALLAPVSSFLVGSAEAANFSKQEGKAFEAEVLAAYPGTVWALKDLPAYTGVTMGAPWLGPAVTVDASGWKADTSVGGSTGYASAKLLWHGVRPNDTLTLKEVDIDDDIATLALVGTGKSKGRDTKIKIEGVKTLAEVKATLDELLATTAPTQANADWPAEIKAAIEKRVVVNGMTKRQAYLVVGEPIFSNVYELQGKKMEMWAVRPGDGTRLGYTTSTEMRNFPPTLNFEDGKLVGVTSGVSLD